ncbi:MAG: class I SAM-dependent methyltransferase [Tateyamaria sp.]|uniref:class I SAM-dependent methyltransferase n=1 Tax=Alphaproteobacteria TaxID=28211 RepID=UPI00329A3789
MDWDEMARPWLEAAPDLEASFGEVFKALFGGANLKLGEVVLDVGCGTGPTLVAAAKAVGESGSVMGIDVAPPLVARASERIPSNVSLIVGDAGSYEYDEGAFDAIIANFGIMFFQDNEVAFRNLRRAVRLGGRMTATVWATPPDNPWFSMPRRIVDEIIPDVPTPDPSGPGPMRFGDPTLLAGCLERAGWKPDIRTIDVLLTPPGDEKNVAELHMKVTVGMMLKGMEVEGHRLEEIREAVIQANREYESEGVIRVPARIHVVKATAC